MRFDHLMHWVPDLEAAIARCTELGFPPQRGGRIGDHLHNGVWVGREMEYVELISVVDLEAWRHGSARPARRLPRGRMLAGGGALQFAFEVDDLAAVVADVRRRGVVCATPRQARSATRAATRPRGRPLGSTRGLAGGRSSSDTRRRAATASHIRQLQQPPPSDWSFRAVVLETPTRRLPPPGLPDCWASEARWSTARLKWQRSAAPCGLPPGLPTASPRSCSMGPKGQSGTCSACATSASMRRAVPHRPICRALSGLYVNDRLKSTRNGCLAWRQLWSRAHHATNAGEPPDHAMGR